MQQMLDIVESHHTLFYLILCHSKGRKTLVFCQTQQMLDIVEKMVGRLGLKYHR